MQEPDIQPEWGMDDAIAMLTPRVKELLGHLGRGLSNRAIAEAMSITVKSTETYINALYRELGLHQHEGIHPRVLAALGYAKETNSVGLPALIRFALANAAMRVILKQYDVALAEFMSAKEEVEKELGVDITRSYERPGELKE
jgi:DNA-binding NarL/FixJ family response regulator